MKVFVSRHAVCAGDDGDAPHARRIDVGDATTIEEIIQAVCASGYLPSIAGGCASWSVFSVVPVAVVAQQWDVPRVFPRSMHELDIVDGELRLQFNYHAQIEPELVFRLLWGLQVRAG